MVNKCSLEEKMSTRERIIEESLDLFAKRGYSGVSVRDIAKAVGVRESALYKHFKNKQDILDQIIIEMQARIRNAYVEKKVPEAVREDVAEGYEELSDDSLKEISWQLFCLYTKDPMVSNYRKLLMKEMLISEHIADLYSEAFLMGVLKRQGETFSKLVEAGMFREEEAQVIALQFYGPIFLLFQQYDCHPEKEDEIKNMLKEHVEAFGRSYENNERKR